MIENIESLSHAALNSTIDIQTDQTLPGDTNQNQNENIDLNTTNSAFVPNESKLTQEKNENEEEKEINEEEELYKKYIDFLNMTEKRFDILFLCHNKQEFLNIMAQEGFKNQNEYDFQNKKKKPTQKFQKK